MQFKKAVEEYKEDHLIDQQIRERERERERERDALEASSQSKQNPKRKCQDCKNKRKEVVDRKVLREREREREREAKGLERSGVGLGDEEGVYIQGN